MLHWIVNKKLGKLFCVLAQISIVINSFVNPLLISQVLASEVTLEVTPEVTATPTEVLIVPTEIPVSPTSTIVPTETPTAEIIETVVQENDSSRTDLLNPNIFTDKADYTPTEIVIISGRNFLPDTPYTLKISADNLIVSYPISTDNTGSFTYSYQLDGIYRPDYLVESIDNNSKVVASTTFTDPPVSNLFFSEYIEGYSFNKALEIYNSGSFSVDITGYKIETYANGDASPTNTITIPTANLTAGNVYVVCHSSIADPPLNTVCNFPTGSLLFNGNDAVVLKDSTGIILDVIGRIGENPCGSGSCDGGWESGLSSTYDQSMTRKCAITGGDTDGNNAFDPGTEWNFWGVNYFNYLGSRDECDTAGPTGGSISYFDGYKTHVPNGDLGEPEEQVYITSFTDPSGLASQKLREYEGDLSNGSCQNYGLPLCSP